MNLNITVVGECLDKIYALGTSQTERHQAHIVLEDFNKLDAITTLNIATDLISSNGSLYRHFGLQAIEGLIKFKWVDMDTDSRIKIKHIVMDTAKQNCRIVIGCPETTGEKLVVEAVAKCIAEMAKREWPQNWPGFAEESKALVATDNPGAISVVLMAWTRLIEDTSIFKTVEPKRRAKDLQLALKDTYPFLIQLITSLVTKSIGSLGIPSAPTHNVSSPLISVCESTLLLLARLLEITSKSVFGDTTLFLDLVHLLGLINAYSASSHMSQLVLRVLDVLVAFTHSKSNASLTEHNLAASLLQPLPLGVLLEMLAQVGSRTKGIYDETAVDVATRLLEVLTNLSERLVDILDSSDPKAEPNNAIVPETLSGFITSLFEIVQHPSLRFRQQTLTIFVTLLKSKTLIQNKFHVEHGPSFWSALRPLVTFIPIDTIDSEVSLVRDYLATPEHVAVYKSFVQNEFESEAGYVEEFHKVRTASLRLYAILLSLDIPPKETHSPAQGQLAMTQISGWVQAIFERQSGQRGSFIDIGQLAGLAKAVDLVAPAIAASPHFSDQRNATRSLLHSLITLFNVYSEAAAFRHCTKTLEILTGWMYFLYEDRQEAAVVMEHLLGSFSCGSRSEAAVREMHHNSAVQLIRVSLAHPDLLLPYFDLLFNAYTGSLNDAGFHSFRGHIAESLLILGSRIVVNSAYAEFLTKTLNPVIHVLSGATFTNTDTTVSQCLSETKHFISYLGLDQSAATFADDTKPYQRRRFELRFVAFVMCALGRRGRIPFTALPEGTGRSMNGTCTETTGQTTSDAETVAAQNVDVRSKAIFDTIMPGLPALFALLKCFNSLYSKDNIKLIHPSYGPGVLDVSFAEKCAHVCTPGTEGDATGSTAEAARLDRKSDPVHMMRTFIWNESELLFQAVGHLVANLGAYFWRLPSASAFFTVGVLGDAEFAVDIRLRLMLRQCLKPILLEVSRQSTSSLDPSMTTPSSSRLSDYSSMLHPIGQLICIIQRRLASNWTTIQKVEEVRRQMDNQDDNATNVQEIFFEQCTCILSRDFFDAINWAFLAVKAGNEKQTESEPPDVDEAMTDAANSASGSNISPLGMLLLNDTDYHSVVISTVFEALKWPDSHTTTRVLPLVLPLLHTVVPTSTGATATGAAQPKDGSNLIDSAFFALLSAFQIHDENSPAATKLLSTTLDVYTQYLASYSSLRNIILQVPELKPGKLSEFERKYIPQATRTQPGESETPPQQQNGKVNQASSRGRRNDFLQLVKGIVNTPVCQAFKRDVQMRLDLPPVINKAQLARQHRRQHEKAKLEGLAALFA